MLCGYGRSATLTVKMFGRAGQGVSWKREWPASPRRYELAGRVRLLTRPLYTSSAMLEVKLEVICSLWFRFFLTGGVEERGVKSYANTQSYTERVGHHAFHRLCGRNVVGVRVRSLQRLLNMPTSARTEDRPHRDNSPVLVLSVPELAPIVVRFLGPYLGMLTHWRSGRSVPCDGPDECPTSLHRLGTIWKGYCPVQLWEEVGRVWRPHVLEVTETLEELLRGRELRGEVWNLWRSQDKGARGSVTGLFCESHADRQLSKSFDILPVLLRLFHRSTLKLGHANPLPPRVVLEAQSGDAPTLPAEIAASAAPIDMEKQRAEARETWRRLREEQARKERNGQSASNGQTGNGFH